MTLVKNIIISITLMLLFSNTQMVADYREGKFSEIIPRFADELIGFSRFDGDSHGDFRGDIVVFLADGSGWKVHPDDAKDLANWQVGDYITINVRTSFYWFKREHKFRLYNENIKESVKAMLVSHSDNPLIIVETSGIYATNTRLEYIWGTDEYGDPTIIGIYEEPCDFMKDLLLSDNSKWAISSNFRYFFPGKKVHVGLNENTFSKGFFLISGIEREAKWSWAELNSLRAYY